MMIIFVIINHVNFNENCHIPDGFANNADTKEYRFSNVKCNDMLSIDVETYFELFSFFEITFYHIYLNQYESIGQNWINMYVSVATSMLIRSPHPRLVNASNVQLRLIDDR